MNMRTEAKEKIEHVLFILDSSGSMESCKKQTIDGVNEQLQELRKTSAIKTFVSFVEFGSSVKTLYWKEPLENVPQLTDKTYVPDGMTAMLDAVGQSIHRLKNDTPTDADDVTFLVIIVSDGAENSSKEYTWQTVSDIVKKCKEDKLWTITYMGANQDLSAVSQSLNIPLGNVTTWASTGTGAAMAYTTMSNGLSNYRGLRMANTSAGLAISGVMASFYSSVGSNTTI